jgi:hypothetical protein
MSLAVVWTVSVLSPMQFPDAVRHEFSSWKSDKRYR